jgi:hypothetical protein
MVLYDFRLFFDKISPFFHQNDPDLHKKNAQKHKLFCKFGPKNIKIARLKNTPARPRADFDFLCTEFAKYFVVLRIFDVVSGSL